MNPRIPWEVVVDPLVSVEHALGTTVLKLISRWASQKIARILRNPTFHCVIPKECVTCLYPEPREVSPHPHALLLCIQFYYSPVQTTIFQMVCFITIFLLTLRIVFNIHATCPSHLSRIVCSPEWNEHIIKPLIMQFFAAYCNFYRLRPEFSD